MKVQVQKLKANGQRSGVMFVNAHDIAIQAPEHGDYILEAMVEDGDSPIRIMLSNGQQQAVRTLRITRKTTYQVGAFHHPGSKPHKVRPHERRLPVSLKNLEAGRRGWSNEQRMAHSKAMKAAYARKRAAERNGGTNGTRHAG